ncbi:MFS transporter [Desertihabitans brevis]|uniref:MFS transporter n=1 Tax=Desertihabitans brevis TaxID=2268447 RepID=UPI0018F67DE0|nr:MFS transporter [Desertihabitans brevis]
MTEPQLTLPRTAPTRVPGARRGVAVLVVTQLLTGIGVASGVAVGGVLAEELAGTASAAGVAQTASIVGAGLASVPLAELAARSGRRLGLAVGAGAATAGALAVLGAAVLGWLPLMVLGMLLFGAATAVGLQARYAAAELAVPERRARTMSVVIWATTVGAVIGPNLSQPGSEVGVLLGLPGLAGPFLFSVVVFLAATLVLAVGLPARRPEPVTGAERTAARASSLRLLVGALRRPSLRIGVVAVVTGHAMMVSVMVMTPVHMNHQGMSLTLVGLVISIHVLGMYAASPVFGWLSDRFGPLPVVLLGAGLFVLAFLGGAFSPESHSSSAPWWLAVALCLLGLGWSACLVGGSAMVAAEAPAAGGVRLQGTVDSAMSLGAAALAALAGPVLAVGGYPSVNLLGAVALVALLVVVLTARTAPAR